MKYSVNDVKYDFLLWHSRGRKGGGPKTLAVESWVRLPSARKTRWRPKCFESVLFSVAILSNSLCRSQQMSLIIATLRYADEFLLRICLEIVYCLQFTGCSKLRMIVDLIIFSRDGEFSKSPGSRFPDRNVNLPLPCFWNFKQTLDFIPLPYSWSLKITSLHCKSPSIRLSPL